MTTIDEIIKQYTTGMHQLDKYRKTLDKSTLAEVEEYDTVAGMLSDMRYAVEWMRHGRRPGSRRGADRKDIYRQRELMTQLKELEPGPDEQLHLAVLLLSMSGRERQCYLLHFAQGLTHNEISGILQISKATVQTFCKRARIKVQQGFTS